MESWMFFIHFAYKLHTNDISDGYAAGGVDLSWNLLDFDVTLFTSRHESWF